jgi:hypothetical protein
MSVNVGLLVMLEAKPGKEDEVAAFLNGGLALVEQEPATVDRLTSGAHTLIIEGPSYRQRHRPYEPPLTARTEHAMLANTSRWSHPPGSTVVPSRWQATSARADLNGWPGSGALARMGTVDRKVG